MGLTKTLLSILLAGTMTFGNCQLTAIAADVSGDVVLDDDTDQNPDYDSESDLPIDLPEDFYTVYPTGGVIDCESPVEIQSISDGRRGLLRGDYLPSYYVNSNLPPLRTQSTYGACWAFSAVALAEISLMQRGVMSDVDLSELHLAYFMYNTEPDPLGGTDCDYTSRGAKDIINYGGRTEWGFSTFARWIGAADESIAPYSLAPVANSTGLDPELAYQDIAHIVNYYEEPVEHDASAISLNMHSNLKRMIRDYGAIAIDFYAYNSIAASYSDSIYNLQTNAYYNPNKQASTNHSVAIVGWDDEFSRDNFATTPPGDGAFLVRNSWRTGDGTDADYGYSGYFWMSYYEATIGKNAYAAEFDTAGNYDNNYQYDGGLAHSAIGLGLAANVFRTHAEGGEEGEILEAVSFYTSASNMEYEIEIYKDLTDDSNPYSGTLVTEATTKGITGYAGLYTVELKESVALDPDTAFAVVLSIYKSDGTAVIGLEYSHSYGTVQMKKGQSFVYLNRKWWDLTNLYNRGNFCIKAYTNNVVTDVEPEEPEPEDPIDPIIPEPEDPEPEVPEPEGPVEPVEPEDPPIELEDIIITSDLAEKVIVGDTYRFAASIEPEEYEPEGEIIWSTDTPTRVKVGQDTGVVTVCKPGPCSVTATLDGMSKSISFDAYPASSDCGFDVDDDNTVNLWWNGTSDASEYRIYSDAERGSFVSVPATDGDDRYTFTDITYKDRYDVSETVYAVGYVIDDREYLVSMDVELKEKKIPVIPLGEKYVIGYHCNGGPNNPNNKTIFYSTDGTFAILDPDRDDWPDGYRFDGWYKEASFSTRVYEASGATGSIELYAKWVPYTYTVHFDGNNATSGKVSDETFTYGIEKVLNANKFARGGYVFAGWARSVEDADSGIIAYTDKELARDILLGQRDDNEEITLYAVWKDDFEISYDTDGGLFTEDVLVSEGLSQSDGLYKGTYAYKRVKSLPKPYRTGYTFNGWYTDNTYKKKVSGITSATYGDISLVAKWTPDSYTISFNGNGATSGRMSALKVKYDSVAVLKDNSYVRRGYKFEGWGLEKETAPENIIGSNEIKVSIEDGAFASYLQEHSGKTITLYAQWAETDYEIRFETNGGRVESNNDLEVTISDGGTATARYEYNHLGGYKLPEPVRRGYSFLGWYSDPGYRNRVKSIAQSSCKDMTLYARWNAKYVVTFDDGSGAVDGISVTGTMKPQTIKYDTNTALTRNKYKNSGYTFIGWAVSLSDAVNGKWTYADGEKIQRPEEALLAMDEETDQFAMTLYAVWKNEFEIRYDLNGGTIKGGPAGAEITEATSEFLETYTAADLPKRLPDTGTYIIEKEGYTFGGWYSDPKLRTRVTTLSKGSTKDRTYYAKWIGRRYSITYNVDSPQKNADTLISSKKQIYTYGTAKAIARNTYKITGYEFAGWSTDSYQDRIEAAAASTGMTDYDELKDYYDKYLYEQDVEYSAGDKVYHMGESYMDNVTLYAVWKKKSYAITYNNVYGSESASFATEYTVDDAYTLPEPERIGHTFLGWYSDPKFRNRVTGIRTGSTGARTFYARWK